MATLDKILLWPPAENMKPVNDLTFSPVTGVSVAKYMTGAGIRRTFYDKPLMKITAKFYISPLDDDYDASMAWFREIESGVLPFMFMDPHDVRWMSTYVGVGNGTQTTWVIPFTGITNGVSIYEDGVLTTTGAVYYDGPNIIEDLADSLSSRFNDVNLTTDPGCGTGTGSYAGIANSTYDEQHRILTVPVLGSGDGLVYTPVTNVNCSALYTLNLIFEAYGNDSFKAELAGGYGTPVTLDDTLQRVLVSETGAYSHDTFRLASNSASACFAGISSIAITRGDLLSWYPANLRMPVVEYITAPTVGVVIIAQGIEISSKVNKMYRCYAKSVSHKINPDGSRFVDVQMEEVPV